VAVVGTDHGVPRQPVLLAEDSTIHGRILHRPGRPGSRNALENVLEACNGVFPPR
jgi:hypothetical protein